MDSSIFLVLAVLIRLIAGLNYLMATAKGRIKPNPITWLFWGVAALVAFLAQIQKTIEPTAWVSLALAIGPLLIFVVAITKNKHWRITKFDFLCGASALIGIILWQITSDPIMAMIFGIFADILGGIPTVRKAYLAPSSEKSLPYLLSMISMVLTLCAVQSWHFLAYAFPLYIFMINLVIYSLVVTKIGVRRAQLLDNNPANP